MKGWVLDLRIQLCNPQRMWKKAIIALCLIGDISYAYMPNDLNTTVNDLVKSQKFSGSVTVFDNSGVIYRNSKGFADAKLKKPLMENDVFKIGSITKMFTAYLVLDSVARGEFRLNSTIGDFLPSSEKIKNIKIENLLNHTAGISNQSMYDRYEQAPCFQANDQDLKTWLNLVSVDSAKVGHFSYSNAGYSILACILEKKMNTRFDKILKQRIFNPLKMNFSGVAWNSKRNQKLIEGLDDLDHKVDFNTSSYFGAGDIISTEEDLMKWVKFLISSKNFDKMTENLVLRPFNSCRFCI